ncbi:MAG TPA: serine hydrolase domain-containing protein, partial [Tepidisphaeraceae bacterium]|nr:serine hydrolase domain-containing protein [Tepidisphaeraceae bacterium]
MQIPSLCAIFLTLLLATGVNAFAAAPPASDADTAKLAAIPNSLAPFIEKHDIAGAVTFVANRGKVLALDAQGMADVGKNEPMKTDAMFWIASMTKPITATAIMMLQEEGKLSVEDPVGKYIPELAHLKTADGKEHIVTLRHLLTHSSGMPEPTGAQSHAARTLAELIPHFAEKPLQFEPGAKWQYCQSGINTLGRIIEVVSGQSYPDFLQARLFDPLGLKDTTFYPNKEQVTRIAKSYKLTDGQLQEVPTPL